MGVSCNIVAAVTKGCIPPERGSPALMIELLAPTLLNAYVITTTQAPRYQNMRQQPCKSVLIRTVCKALFKPRSTSTYVPAQVQANRANKFHPRNPRRLPRTFLLTHSILAESNTAQKQPTVTYAG